MSNTRFQEELKKQRSCDIEKIDYEKEFMILEATMVNLKHLKPMFHRRMHHTGTLFQYILHNLYESTKKKEFQKNLDYILAAFYCNMGFIAIESSLYKGGYTNENDLRTIKRHIYISHNLMQEKKLYTVSEIVKRHHEKPDGSGYLKEQNTSDKQLAIVNISDVFIDNILPSKRPEVALMLEEAIYECMKGYTTGLLLDNDEQDIVVASIITYFKEYMN